jgi:hypothetical protein
MICNNLAAMAITGTSADPVGAVSDTYHYTRAQVDQAINDACPKLQNLEP